MLTPVENSRGPKELSPIKHKIVRPSHILPFLHEKTHFKAAAEYSMVQKNEQRSLKDRHRESEKFVEEAHFSIQSKLNESKIPSKLKRDTSTKTVEITMDEREDEDDSQYGKNKVVMDDIDPKIVTRDMLRQCKVFRTKN